MKSKLVFSFVLVAVLLTEILAQNNSQKPEQIPNWLNAVIEKGTIGKSPITDIKSYIFNEKLVYLVNYDAGCCDHFSAILYDKDGNKICSPFGGITGRGDMQCPDFMAKP